MALVLIFCFSTVAFASSLQDEITAKKAAQQELSTKADALKTEMQGLKSKLIDTSRQVRETEESLAIVDAHLKNLQGQKLRYTTALYRDQDALGGFITAADKLNRTSMPEILLQADPLDAARASLIMKSMIPELNFHSDQVKTQLATISGITDDISRELAVKSKEYSKLNQQESELTALLDQRREIYSQTEKDRRAQEEEVQKLAREAKNLEDLVDKMQPRAREVSVAVLKLPRGIVLPVHGTVHTAFGERDDIGGKSKGITFNARTGATVVTPLAGTVKFAGPFQKYKQILIVEHPGGYHSLIAGLGRIDTVVGAALEAGEPVGAAETSGADAQIYYELRQNGAPVNPQKLSVAQRKQDRS